MNELSKQADVLLAPALERVKQDVGSYKLVPTALLDRSIALGNALATLALVQATEAQTKALDQLNTTIQKVGNRR
jgi:hypothetical protein